MAIVKENIYVEGTTCGSCEKIIKKQAKKVRGVKSVEFDYKTQVGMVKYDDAVVDIDDIFESIDKKGFSSFILDDAPNKKSSTFGWIMGIIGILLVGYFMIGFIEGISMPQITQNISYGLLFVVGLLTGFHCISMCGGFVVSYTANRAKKGNSETAFAKYKDHAIYGVAKTLSYTVIGAVFGLLGSIIAFTPLIRGIAGIMAGLFLIIFGLRMFNVFDVLRKFSIRTPSFIAKWTGRSSDNPLFIGLLNGLMIACGPLQAIYVLAAGTGSMIEGAKLLFIFGLGTLPALLGFGIFASFATSKLTSKILKASGAVVIVLGLLMLNNGLVLTGSGYDVGSLMQTNTIDSDGINEIASKENGEFQEIRMTVDRSGWTPNKFVLKKGVPVKWIIDGKEITGCNNAIQVPSLGLEFPIENGEQIIEFTPEESGVIRWSCWMGMIPGVFIIEDSESTETVEKTLDSVDVPETNTCGGSCDGGCAAAAASASSVPTCGAASSVPICGAGN